MARELEKYDLNVVFNSTMLLGETKKVGNIVVMHPLTYKWFMDKCLIEIMNELC